MSYQLGIDIGGTFTDFVLYEDVSGVTVLHKRLTTPVEPADSVIAGVNEILSMAGADITDLTVISHGTTLVTNTVIERRGAVTGMLTTCGFRDVLSIGMERRYDLFDLRLRFPAPLVPRPLHMEVEERVGADGIIQQPLDETGLRRAVDELVTEGKIVALAVGLLNSYANPIHEERIREIVQADHPTLYVSTSADVSPFMREYERWTTTTVNAYTQPMVDDYLKKIENGLANLGFGGDLFIMTSNGGTIAPGTARRYPVRLLESGPAAGVLMSTEHGRNLKLPDILSFDMGGTTAKGSLVENGAPLRQSSLEIARIHQHNKGSGLPVRIPVIDMIEIGAGGGSIAEVDDRGLIRVGPRSAGADPGPACYGLGGTSATLTDANLVLGYLDPEFFLGGTMALDRRAAESVIRQTVANPLELEFLRAAWGIHEIVNEDVARAFRVHASERGFDYRDCTMIAFGGSGPIHALRIARKLSIPRVVLPVGAGVMSAFGLLASPRAFEVVQSGRVFVNDLDGDDLAGRFAPLIDEAVGQIVSAGVATEAVTVSRRVDIRYFGQGHEVEVEIPPGIEGDAALAALPDLFAKAYSRIYSISFLDSPLEIVNWKVDARAPASRMSERYRVANDRSAGGTARKKMRRAWFPENDGYTECPVFNRYALTPGEVVVGPALIEEAESTCVVGVGDRVEVDAQYNLVAEIATEGELS